jgi:hypothetical protein
LKIFERVEMLQKIIYPIFGKPLKNSKYFLFIYWMPVIAFLLSMVMLFIQAIFNGGWINLLITAIVFPMMFRIVNFVVGSTNNFMSTRINKRLLFIMIGSIIGLTIVGFTYLFLNSGNVAMVVNKVVTNGDIKLSIGSLKGYHTVESFMLEESEGYLEIPYEASVEEGEITLIVEKSVGNEIVWEKDISTKKSGLIVFDISEGDYDIRIYTEKAKNVKLKLELYEE